MKRSFRVSGPMHLANLCRTAAVLFIAGLMPVMLSACGSKGGGASSSGSGGGPSSTPPPTARPSATQLPGTVPPEEDTPTPEPPPTFTPQPTVIVLGGDIAAAARVAPPGAMVIVAPGSYAPFALAAGDVQGPLTIVADVTGQLTGGAPAAVTILASSHPAGILLTDQTQLIVDGFTVRGGDSGGIFVQGGSDVTVRNCIVSGSGIDAVSVEGTAGALIFNNLVYDNAREGIAAFGSSDLQIINNTIYHNGEAGIFIGFDDVLMAPSTNTSVTNNIINNNQAGHGIEVDITEPSSLGGYSGDYNLNTDGYDGAPVGRFDIDLDPTFIAPGRVTNDFHILGSSLAGSGRSPAIDAGDPATPADLVAALVLRTTQSDAAPDVPPVDLGYHYTGAFFPPTPTETSTPRPTSGATRTPTRAGTPGTRTPTRAGTPGSPTATRPGGSPAATATPSPTSTPTPTRRGPQHSPTRTRVAG